MCSAILLHLCYWNPGWISNTSRSSWGIALFQRRKSIYIRPIKRSGKFEPINIPGNRCDIIDGRKKIKRFLFN